MNKPIPTLTESNLKRFWAKVEVRGPDDCWKWTAYTNRGGYGSISINGQPWIATRIAYYIRYGEDPGEKYVCHTCDNPGCCNPAHLWLGTLVDNNRDKTEKGRNAKSSQLPITKLTEKDIRKIRKSKEPQKETAKRFNVDPSTISHIKRGVNWKHVN